MQGILRKLRELWRGELPLETAFWHYAIYYGLILNLIATMFSVVMLLNELPIALVVAVHLSPLPYSVLAAVGVWRCADRYPGQPNFATFARVGVIVWFCVWVAL